MGSRHSVKCENNRQVSHKIAVFFLQVKVSHFYLMSINSFDENVKLSPFQWRWFSSKNSMQPLKYNGSATFINSLLFLVLLIVKRKYFQKM